VLLRLKKENLALNLFRDYSERVLKSYKELEEACPESELLELVRIDGESFVTQRDFHSRCRGCRDLRGAIEKYIGEVESVVQDKRVLDST
jgi:hypothetical protein